MVRAEGGVAAVFVEINAVRAGVVEHAVQNDRNAFLLCFFAQGNKVVVRAEQRVDVFVIRRVVAVVGMRFKNGVEIQAGHAEAFQIIELLLDALEVAAEIVVVQRDAFLVRFPHGHVGFVFVQRAVVRYVLLGKPGRVKPVGKDLIDHAAAKGAVCFG